MPSDRFSVPPAACPAFRQGMCDESELSAHETDEFALTPAQQRALTYFVPNVWRAAFPDINPRTASALWQMGLIRGKTQLGKQIFCLTEAGAAVQIQIAKPK